MRISPSDLNTTRREFLQRCKNLKKQGLISDSDDSDESSDESSGDDAVQDDLQFYDALVRVKKNDSTILQKDAKLFSSSEDHGDEPEKKKPKVAKKVKPLYLKDVNTRQLMEDGPEIEGELLKENPKMFNTEQVENLKAFFEAENRGLDRLLLMMM
ncbi:hypothetical protein KSP39_PZI015415 [Platanthera zijinensis]|uniref:Uncharacterized protein n=1 Tax=Platanthera zijinensis TaxID=2320716 RepID=A0AAP0B8F5_9ASPA